MEIQQRRSRETPFRSWAASRRPNFSRKQKYARRHEAEKSFREMLVQQCIVSGLILFVALMMNFIPMSFANELRGGVKRALSQEGSADGLLDAAGGIADRYESLKNSIKSVFEAPSAGVADQWQDSDIPMGTDYSSETVIDPRGDDTGVTPMRVYPDADVRIDENVLKGINTGMFYEVDEAEKKR